MVIFPLAPDQTIVRMCLRRIVVEQRHRRVMMTLTRTTMRR